MSFKYLLNKTILLLSTVYICVFSWIMPAYAMPSFSRQTGDACSSCHVGAYGPQLTPHGIAFKLGGYTDNNGSKSIPLSVFFNGTFTNTRKDQNPAPTNNKSNNNVTFQEFSALFAGKVSDHIGAFAQVTYSNIDHTASLDHVDIRYAKEVKLFSSSDLATIGLSLNNSPTAQDPFGSLPVWGYPYIGSDLAPSPAAQTLLQSGLDGRLFGVTAYTLLPNGIYAEGGLYEDQSSKLLNIEKIKPDIRTQNASPYLRLAYYKPYRESTFSVGVVGMQSKIQPIDSTDGMYDKNTDVGFDANYLYLGNRRHIFTGSFSYIYERERRDESFANGGATNLNGNLKTLNMMGSYTFANTYGANLGFFDTVGTFDDLFYPDSANGKPDSRGYIVEANWTPFGKDNSWKSPWANVRVGLQYTIYTKFNGARLNYDGAGNNSTDNNTFTTYIWTAF